MNDEELLPVGSVIYLNGGTLKLVILARGQFTKEGREDNKSIYYDYLGSLYPQGFDVNDTYYFNHGDIKQVVFKGYLDDEEKRYIKLLKEWKNDHEDEYILGNVNTDE